MNSTYGFIILGLLRPLKQTRHSFLSSLLTAQRVAEAAAGWMRQTILAGWRSLPWPHSVTTSLPTFTSHSARDCGSKARQLALGYGPPRGCHLARVAGLKRGWLGYPHLVAVHVRVPLLPPNKPLLKSHSQLPRPWRAKLSCRHARMKTSHSCARRSRDPHPATKARP